MKKLLALALGSLLWANPAFAISVANAVAASRTSTATQTWTVPTNITVANGDTVCVVGSEYSSDVGFDTTTPVTDPSSNPYTIVITAVKDTISHTWVVAACAVNVTGWTSSNVTLHMISASTNIISATVFDISGALTSGSVDLKEISQLASTTTPSYTTTGATAVANEAVLATITQANAQSTMTEDAAYTSAPTTTWNTSGVVHINGAYKTISSTGKQTYAPTLASATASQVVILTVKGTGVTATVCTRSLLGVGC